MKRNIETTFSFGFDLSDDEGSSSPNSRTQSKPELQDKLSHLYPKIEKMTELPYTFAICREPVFTLKSPSPILSSGDLVIVHWLNSGFYDLAVFPVFSKWIFNESTQTHTPPTQLNLFTLQHDLQSNQYITPNLGFTHNGPAIVYPSHSTFQTENSNSFLNSSPISSQSPSSTSFPTPLTSTGDVEFLSIDPFTISPIIVQLNNLTFISPIETIHTLSILKSQSSSQSTSNSTTSTTQSITQPTPTQINSLHCDRESNAIFELFPFLKSMSFPTTHPIPSSIFQQSSTTTSQSTTIQHQSTFQTPSYPSHFSSAPLTIDSTLSTWVWPVDQTFFKQHLYSKKCFIVHAGAQRLSRLQKDFSNFHVKNLIESASNSVIWMKSQPIPQPIIEIGQNLNERVMQYVSAPSPESAYAAYLAGNTIYFNPPDQIQAKYVKNLAIELGHNYGYTPGTNLLNVDDEEGFSYLDEMTSFGGDLEVFAVITKHVTDWHFDSQDNISIQLIGTKKWTVVPGIQDTLTNYHAKSTNKQSVVADKHMHQISTESEQIAQKNQLSPSEKSTQQQLSHTQSTEQTNLNKTETETNPSVKSRSTTPIYLNNTNKYSNQLKNNATWPNLDTHPEKQSFIVRPGSIFYHPAGTYHRVDALDDDGSLSINVSLDPMRYSDVLLSQLGQLIMSHPTLRQRINSNTQNAEQVLQNALDEILPQIVQVIKGKQSNTQQFSCSSTTNTSQSQSSNPTTSASQQPPFKSSIQSAHSTPSSNLLIPALFSHNQIHDYPITTVLSKPPSDLKNPLYYPLSSLIYRDQGCINLAKQLNFPNNITFSATSSFFAPQINSSTPFFELTQFTLVKPNQFVKQYFPQFLSLFQSPSSSSSSSSPSIYTTHFEYILNCINPNQSKTQQSEEVQHNFQIEYNSTVHLVSNEPSYISPSIPPSNSQYFDALIQSQVFNIASTQINNLNHFIHNAPNATTVSNMTDAASTTSNTFLSSSTAIQYDLSTIPTMHSQGKFQNAIFHLFSLCFGISSHSSSSTITSSASGIAKNPPQFSIGVVIDKSKFILHQKPNIQHAVEIQSKSTSTSTSSTIPKQPQPENSSLLSTIFLHQLLFLHYLIFAQKVHIHTPLQLINMVLKFSQISVSLIQSRILSTQDQSTTSITTGFEEDKQTLFSAEHFAFLQMTSSLLMINLISLYTHCGFFRVYK